MRILLYKPDSKQAFRTYSRSCEIIVDDERKKVAVINPEIQETGNNPVMDIFRLVRKQDPMWTDDSKSSSEIMVKIVVEDIKLGEID